MRSDDDARFTTAARLRAAADAMVSREVDAATLDRLSMALDDVLPDLAAGARRDRAAEKAASFFLTGPSPDRLAPWDEGVPLPFDSSWVSGPANPSGMAGEFRLLGSEVEGRVRFPHSFEGPPERAHGGAVAGVFDEVTGVVLVQLQQPAFTRHLEVDFHEGVPLDTEITFRARLDRTEGRKLFITADAWLEARCLAEATALYVTVPTDRFRNEIPTPGS